MKAAVWVGVNKVDISNVPVPIPRKNEVLLKVKSAGICATDIHIINGGFQNGEPPHILGHEVFGEVVEQGQGVEKWSPGDRVVVETTVGCGDCALCRAGMKHLCRFGGEIGYPPYQGGYAQYVCVPESCLIRVPEQISDDEAGILESFVCAAGCIIRLGLKVGDTVLIQGAGPAGLAFVQAAKLAGASKVIVAAKNKVRLVLAKEFGADVVVNVDMENIEERVMDETDGCGVSVSIEAVGIPSTIYYSTKLAAPNGKVILYGIPSGTEKTPLLITDMILNQLTVYGCSSNPHAWETVLQLIAGGRFTLKGMVTHKFTLDQFVEAIDCVSQRRDGLIKAVIHPWG